MTHILTADSYISSYQQQKANKMPISESFSGHHTSFNNGSNSNRYAAAATTGLDPSVSTATSSSLNFDTLNKRLATEDTMIEVLKNNNIKQQIDILDELVHRMQQTDGLIYFHKLDELLNCIRSLLLNSLNNELQVACLKCIFNMLKSMEKIKLRKEITNILHQIDKNLLQIIMPSVIPLCASTKIQVRQYSIDILYLYMKQTNNLQQLFSLFIRYGIDNPDILISKGFIESLNSLLTDEYRYEDYTDIVKSLIKHLVETTLEKSCMKALKRIELLVRDEAFNGYLNKLSANIKNYYLNLKKQDQTATGSAPQQKTIASTTSTARSLIKKEIIHDIHMNSDQDNDDDENEDDGQEANLKFNIISNRILKKLFGEDELQRLQAIEQLEANIKNLDDVSVIYPYYEDFVIFIGNFIDDNNYKVRVGALEVLYSFVKKLKSSIENCYKIICTCAKTVMSQTHQSKTIKQLIMNILLLAIDNMKNPNLIVDALLEKIKDKSAKCREEIINVLIATLIKFGSYKFDLINIFRKIVPLLFDIKRNVRYVVLECVAVLYSKMKDKDRNLDLLFNLLDMEDHNLQTIKTVVDFRLSRNKYAILNTDMTIEYAIKLPTSTSLVTTINGNEPDIDWIISASTSSSHPNSGHHQNGHHMLSAASSARSIRSVNEFEQNIMPQQLAGQQQQTILKRKPSAKRLPWETEQYSNGNSQNVNLTPGVPKVMRSREVAPLKAFPFEENLDIMAPSFSSFKSNYPSTSSYQEKYLKRMQSNQYQFNDKPKDLQDITNQSIYKNEKAHSLDSLYNFDDEINQRRKQLNPLLNSNNGIMPSKPTIPRRNSGNRATPTLSNENEKKLYSNDDMNVYKNEQINIYNEPTRKYDTMPTLRTSAKNRKQLDKLFSMNNNDTTRTSVSKNNEFLNTPRTTHSPDHYSESGVFSLLSENDHHNEKNGEYPSTRRNYGGSSNDSDYSSNVVESPFNSKPKLLRSNSKPKLNVNATVTSNGTNNSTNNKNGNNTFNATSSIEAATKIYASSTNTKPPQQQQQQNVEIVGKKLMSNGNQILTTTATTVVGNLVPPPMPTNSNNNNNNNGNSGSNANTDTIVNTNWKKKAAALRSLNETSNPNIALTTDDDNSMLDIVGKGLFYPTTSNENVENDYLTNSNDNQINMPDEIDFPLSLSFQSRLRQKTQEKIEERLRKKSIKKYKQEQLRTPPKDDIINNDIYSNSDNQLKTTDFGLSISGYITTSNHTVTKAEPSPTELKPSSYSEIFSELKSNDYKSYNNIDDSELALGSPYTSSNSSMFPQLEQNVKHRPPINDTVTRKPPKFNARSKSLNRNNNNLTPTNEHQAPTKSASDLDSSNGIYGPVKDDFQRQPFKNPDAALKDAMVLLSQDEWEKKCHAMNIIKRLSAYHEDLVVSNIHSIVVALLQEVRNLRSQVSRFALSTCGELFTNHKRYMDIDLDIAVKTILQKNGESSDFIRSDVEKCLDIMIVNVTPHKALAALINGGASHRNPLVRKTAAQFIFKICEVMGPGKILSGIKDVTERVLITAASFVVDGPPDIRWYGRKIFHMLMSYDEFDRMLVKYLNESTRKNIKEILDSIRVKGPGDVPSESARLSRKSIRNTLTRDPISKSAGSSNPIAVPFPHHSRFDPQAQEDIKELAVQMRNTDFRERIDAVEKFQILCETETDLAVSNMVMLFDKFCQCLTDSNSKVNYKALNTMLQITPILGDNLSAVIQNVVPLIAQNLASKNNEIQDIASNILDIFVEYLDGGMLIQPFANLAQHGNARIKPQIINKLADLVPHVYSRKQKQVELHILPTLWGLLNIVKGSSLSNASGSLNSSVARLVQSLYQEMGELLIERAANNSNVPARNLELLRNLASEPAN